MKRTVLIFGLISGLISAGLMAAFIPFIDRIGFDKGMIFGYTSITLSMLLVFFGIRSYRENTGNGSITLLRALGVGILITLISCVIYVAAWEIISPIFFPDFMEKYSAYYVKQLQASGATQEVINQQLRELEDGKRMYANPFLRPLFVFLEPFPVGVLVTLISAIILRRRKPPVEVPTPPPPAEFA